MVHIEFRKVLTAQDPSKCLLSSEIIIVDLDDLLLSFLTDRCHFAGLLFRSDNTFSRPYLVLALHTMCTTWLRTIAPWSVLPRE